MLWLYESFFPVVWIIFVLYWQIKAADTKATQRLERAASRILRVLTFLIAIVLLSIPRIPLPWLYVQLWPSGYWPFWLGAALTVAGLLFAIWAREHLGRNWSRFVTIKQGHELSTTGPYAVVRHPIYTGILTGFLGMAIAILPGARVPRFCPHLLPLCSGSSSAWRRNGCAPSLGRRMLPTPDRPSSRCPTSSDRLRRLSRLERSFARTIPLGLLHPCVSCNARVGGDAACGA
jgi:protein-S-isoprenylcysteine O-methyltransferase Ste14